jgi:hypothetical protein
MDVPPKPITNIFVRQKGHFDDRSKYCFYRQTTRRRLWLLDALWKFLVSRKTKGGETFDSSRRLVGLMFPLPAGDDWDMVYS